MKQLAIFIILVFAAVHSFAMEKKTAYRKTKNFGAEFTNLGSFESDLISFLSDRPETERTVVEFGAGFGRLALDIVSKIEGVEYFCTDISQEQIDEVNERGSTTGRAKNSQLKAFVCNCCSELEFEFATESADAVVIANVFHFLHPKEVLKVLGNASRILKPGGRLYVMSQTPHFVMKDILSIVESTKESIQEKTKKASQQEKISASIQEERKLLNRLEPRIYYSSCYSEMFKLYSEQKFEFPGYMAQHAMTGLGYAPDGSTRSHNAMNRKFLFTLTGELLAGMAKPFGFEIVSSKEYLINTEEGAKEVETGPSFGLILVKNGEQSLIEIEKLVEEAGRVDENREAFHKEFPVKYSPHYPYVTTLDICTSCQKIAGYLCPCKKVSNFSSACQKND